MTRGGFFLTSSLALAFALPTAAFAQAVVTPIVPPATPAPSTAPGTAAQVAPDKPADQQNAVAEVLVTAQKRVEKLQDVPISIEVVSGAKLDDFHATDFKSIMNFTPNVFVESTAGDDVIYIRGFGSPPANFSFDQSVSLYIDGVYAGRSRQAQAPFFDLQRVEVLRGPQGALFGKNTPAGAVNIISAGPTSTFQGEGTAIYNFDFQGYDLSGFVSGPITDTLSARLAVRFLDEDGYIKNRFNGHDDPEDDQKLARFTLRWAPSPKFDLTLKTDYGDRRVTGGITVSSPLTSAQDPQDTRYIDDTTRGNLGREGTKTNSWLTSATANLQIGNYTLTSVTGYSFFRSNIVNDFDQTVPGGTSIVPNSVYNSYPEHFRQVSQEVRLLSPLGHMFEYVVGGYYDQSLYRLTQLGGFDIASPALNYYGLLNTNFQQRAESYSLFGNLTWHVFDKARLVGSLRYTDTEKRANFNGQLLYGPFALRPLTSAQGSESEDHIDPSITAQYDLFPHVMLYATYGKGSKSGGFVSNTYGTTNATFGFKPEESENYEGGIKSTLFDGRATLNISIYDTSFTNLQVSVYNPTTSSYLTGNAASASSKGVEAAATWFPNRNFDVTGSLAYQDASYDNYPGAACLASQPISACNPASPASILANNIKGAPLPYTSKFTGNIQGHWRLDLPGDSKLDTTVVVSGRSKYFDSDNQSPIFGVQDAYAKVDLRVQYAPANDRWHVALVGKNLTDEHTTGSAFNLPAPITAVPRAILYLEPTRNISIEFGAKF